MLPKTPESGRRFAFWGASGGAPFPGVAANRQKGIDVIGGIRPAILMKHRSAWGDTWSPDRNPVRYHITGGSLIGKGKIEDVRALIANDGGDAVPMEFAGGVTEKITQSIVFPAQADSDFRDRTGIRIDENLTLPLAIL